MVAKWYILHTVSGSEKRVKQMIQDQIAKKGMSDQFEEIVVPVIEVPEIKRGKQVITEKKFMPGYILIKMKMTDESWHLVKGVPKITGFLGTKTKPNPTATEILDFHQFTKSDNKEFGLQINRNDILKTVSITQCEISNNKIEMHYVDLFE